MSQNDARQKLKSALRSTWTVLQRTVAVPLWVFAVAILVGGVTYAIYRPRAVKSTQEVSAESYAVGFALGQQLTPVKDQIFPDVVARGLRHGINANSDEQPSDLSKEERQAALARIQNRQATLQQSKAADEAKRSIDFMNTVRAKANVRELEKGVIIEPVGETKGPLAQPKERTTVTLAFQAKLADGKVFDQSPETGTEVRTDALLLGLRKAISKMPEGAHWNIYLSPDMAFGPASRPGVPAGSAVVYTIKLLKAK